MLKIKAPIEFKCNTDVTSIGDSFGEHIRANYGVMGAGLNGEELLHLVSRPPEIYLGEGGITNLVNESNIENRQYNKVEIINNFLNRVLVDTDVGLTYQDRVFMTSVLNQLGIKDERHFMEQVRQIKQEVNNTEELVNLYWDNLYHLETLVSDYREVDESTTDITEISENKTELYLHENIMNRLMTGAIYQIVENFSNHTSGDTTITGEEYKISEQNRITQNILLNRLQNVVRHEEMPLTFHHENIYEESIGGDTEITEETVNSQVNSAVLLNMIDNIFQSRHTSFSKGGDKLYHMESVFYEGADNTIQRITHNAEQSFVYAENFASTEERVEQLGDEIDIINSILYESRTDQLRLLTDADYRQYRNTNYRGGDVRNETNIDISISGSGDNIVRSNNVNISGDTVNYGDIISNQDTMILRRDGDNVDINDSSVDIENINRELTLINEQNMVRNEEYNREFTRITNEINNPQSAHGSQRRAQDVREVHDSSTLIYEEAGNRDLGDSGDVAVINQYNIESNEVHQNNLTRLAKEYADRPSNNGRTDSEVETSGSFETLNLIYEDNHREENAGDNNEVTVVNQQNTEQNEEYYSNLTRITNEMKQALSERRRNRAVTDSLKALENPVQFLKEVRAEEAVRKDREQKRKDAIVEAMPPKERVAARLIREYLERPEVFRDRKIVTENNLTQLMADINRVERENRIHEEREAVELVQKDTVTELVTETVREIRQAKPEIKVEERQAQEISLVHKSQETLVNEEIIDEIVAQNYRIERQNERIETFVKNNQTETKTIVNNIEHHTVEEQNQDVNEVVKRSIQGQMDTITDKVYNKLSKRLANEKIRRGL